MKYAAVRFAIAFCSLTSIAAAAPFPTSGQQNALAASTTAINPVTNVYQEFRAKCSGNCTMIFPAVKNDTIILHVSCGFDVTPANLFAVVLETSGATPQAEELLNSFASKGSTTTISVDTASYYFVSKGQKPQVLIAATSKVTGAICTLSGIHNLLLRGLLGPHPLNPNSARTNCAA